MSWNVVGEVNKENMVDQVMQMVTTSELGEGAKAQLSKAKEIACELIASETARGERFRVSLSGHSQSDNPGSAPDSISISIYVLA